MQKGKWVVTTESGYRKEWDTEKEAIEDAKNDRKLYFSSDSIYSQRKHRKIEISLRNVGFFQYANQIIKHIYHTSTKQTKEVRNDFFGFNIHKIVKRKSVNVA